MIWTIERVGQLWSGQFMMYMAQAWEQRGLLKLDWPYLHELAASIANYGVQVPLMVRLDIEPPRLAQGHHRYIAARVANLTELPVAPPQFSLAGAY